MTETTLLGFSHCHSPEHWKRNGSFIFHHLFWGWSHELPETRHVSQDGLCFVLDQSWEVSCTLAWEQIFFKAYSFVFYELFFNIYIYMLNIYICFLRFNLSLTKQKSLQHSFLTYLLLEQGTGYAAEYLLKCVGNYDSNIAILQFPPAGSHECLHRNRKNTVCKFVRPNEPIWGWRWQYVISPLQARVEMAVHWNDDM